MGATTAGGGGALVVVVVGGVEVVEGAAVEEGIEVVEGAAVEEGIEVVVGAAVEEGIEVVVGAAVVGTTETGATGTALGSSAISAFVSPQAAATSDIPTKNQLLHASSLQPSNPVLICFEGGAAIDNYLPAIRPHSTHLRPLERNFESSSRTLRTSLFEARRC